MRRRYSRRGSSYKRRRTSVTADNLAIAKLLSKHERLAKRSAALDRARAVLAQASSMTNPTDHYDAQGQHLGRTAPIISAESLYSRPARDYFSGRGAYSLGDFMRQAEPYADRFLTKGVPKIASAISQLSPYAGALKQFMGRGSYNNLIEGGHPSMTIGSPNDETQSMVISHCEFLQDIYAPSSSAFSVQSWSLNPGLSENFPWLAQIAANYEEYEFIQLMFHFKSTVDASATNNSNGSTGTIILATNYNPTAPVFPNKETMMQYHGAISGRITEDHIHGVECDPSKNAGTGQKYVRFLPVQLNQDLKTFDLGIFQLAQVNLPSTFWDQQVGELWVSYSVKLTKPRLATAILANAPESRWVGDTGCTAQNPLGTGLLSMQQNSLAIELSNPATGQIQFDFPNNLTGLLEIQLFFEGTIGMTQQREPITTLSGNVESFYDLFAAADGTGDNPTWINYTNNNTSGGVQALNPFIIMHVFVSPQVGSTTNSLIVDLLSDAYFFSNAAISQIQIVVRMINSSLAQSTTLDVPAYVNSVGQVVQPY